MALADRLTDTPQRITGLPCSVGALEDFLEGAEADAFYAMLHTLGWSQERIYAAIQAEAKLIRETTGASERELQAAALYASMGKQTINRHRARGCRCFKAAS